MKIIRSSSKPSGTSPSDPDKTIAFQGLPGAYSDLACREVYPKLHTLPTDTFEETFAAVEEGRARLAMIPIENSVAGRVADIHRLMPHANLHIVGEHFQRVEHHLLGVIGAKISDLKVVRSHVHALAQCRKVILELGLKAVVHADTAGSARELAERGDKTEAAIASSLAAEIYGLKSLRANIEDAEHNTTRFVILAREAEDPGVDAGPLMTSFVFRVRNIPAALYKALGGFATNGVNMTKLESYMVNGSFVSAQFYAEVEGHPESRPLRLAFEELGFYSDEVRILGVYPLHPFRGQAKKRAAGKKKR
jgi:prephenate dehydratase